MRFVAYLAASCCLAGCGSGPGTPGHPGADSGSLDGGAVWDAEADARSPSDAAVTDAAVTDAAVTDAEELAADAGLVDASPDAPRCAETCLPSALCLEASCVDEVCVQTPVADGLECGEVVNPRVCAAGVCVRRTCGDGYREPGPAPAREGCDDGNALDGDACSSLCEPTVLRLEGGGDPDLVTEPTAAGPAAAVDGEGRLLVVWKRVRVSEAEVVALRLDAAGSPLEGGSPLVVDPLVASTGRTDPVVAGLPSGWVVVWTSARDADSEEVLFRLVRPDGTLGPEQRANTQRGGAQAHARVVGLSDGFVVAWEEPWERIDDRGRGLRARVFSATGAARTEELLPATSRLADQGRPSLASEGDRWLLLWLHADRFTPDPPTVQGRRFEGSRALDATQFAVSLQAGLEAAASSLGAGEWAIGWSSAAADLPGDIRYRLLGPGPAGETAGTETAFTSIPMHAERRPAVTSFGGGDLLLAWEDETAGVDFGSAMGTPLPAEALELASLLAAERASAITLVHSDRGVFFVWARRPSGSPWPGLGVYLLPYD